MTDSSTRLDALERKLALATRVAVSSLFVSIGLAALLAFTLTRPLRVSSLYVTSADGARTSIEGGRIRLSHPSGNRVTVEASASGSTVALAADGRSPVSPEMVLRVNTAGTPASVLLSDRRARNFTHLYVSDGRAGLELAGLREYQNIATP